MTMSLQKRKPRRSLAPGEMKILRVLESKRKSLKSYKTLREETALSDPVLSDYLKRLQKRKFIKRDIDTRKYSLTVRGKRRLEFSDLVKKLDNILEHGKTTPVKFTPKTSEAFPTVKAPETKKNLEIVANCEWVIHQSLLEMFPKIKESFGTDFFLRTSKTANGKILVEISKA